MTDFSDLRSRIISALLLGIGALSITLFHTYAFAAMVLLGVFFLMREWHMLTGRRHWLWLPLGVLYIGGAGFALIYLRHENLNILLSLLAIVIAADVGGYFVGKRFGKHKIAPTISPGKSWEGLAGSIIAAAAVGASTGYVAPLPHAILGATLAIVGLGGDMFESRLKRTAGVKDSGRLIPGHGGLFDRLDALLPCAILAALALYIRTQG